MITFGCEAGKGVAAESTIAKTYFEHIKSKSSENGVIQLPKMVQTYRT